MAAAWQASGTLLGSTGADITPVIPTHQADDILILVAAARSNSPTLATPSGWTLKHGPSDTSATWRAYVFYRRATSGSTTNPLCDWSSTTGDKYGQVHTIRGAITTGDPFAASAFDGATVDPYQVLGVTTTAANQLVIAAGIGADNVPTTIVVTATDPASWTEHHYSDIATGADAAGWFASATRTSAGATGDVLNDPDGSLIAVRVFVAAVLDATVVDADAEVSWAELEVPTANSDAEVSWAEFEVPTANSAAEVSWAELEVPTANADAEVSWTELEVPDSTVDADAEISWAEVEIPDVAVPDSDAEVSWAELEVPTADSAAEISWAEVEVPTADSSAHVSWAEFEVPTANSAAEVAWASLEVEDPASIPGDFVEDYLPTHHS